MVDIENPLLSEAYKHLDSLFLLRKVKGSSVLNGKKAIDIRLLPFKDVQFIKDSLNEPSESNMIEIIKMVFNYKDFKTLRVHEFYQAYNYIIEQIKDIIDKEKMLSSEPDNRLVTAGIERMNIFGALNIIDDIARRYSQPPMLVENWSYNWIFSLSLKIKIENDIQKALEWKQM